MALHAIIDLRMRCERHPRYTPQNGGEAAIKAGCTGCYALLAVYRRILAAAEELGKIEGVTITTEETARKGAKKLVKTKAAGKAPAAATKKPKPKPKPPPPPED